jgi:uncharacterized protein YjbJ (UPF0337 family)
MNRDIAKGNFKQIKGKIKQQWGKLTDDEIDQMEGSAEILVGKLQERYGLGRDEAERQAREFRTENNWTTDADRTRDADQTRTPGERH